MKLAIFSFFVIATTFISCTTQKSSDVELIIDSKSVLGEGAFWDNRSGELLWVDINGKILNFYNPRTGNNKEMFTGQKIGTVVPTESGNVLVALQKGIYSFDINTGSKKMLAAPKGNNEEIRFNDGKCDPAGRFWAGTMSTDGKENAGALYRFDGDTTLHKMIEEVSISNGIVWSLDKTKMYYIDTPTQKVMTYEYDNATGEIANPKIAIEVPTKMGYPDGMTIDAEGNLWIALWGGFSVTCWSPETGELLKTIKVPAKNVTSCAFGDADLGTLYITTAREGNTDDELKEYPLSGGVFKTIPGVKGVEAFFFNDNN